jgi:hypothetical protein
MEPALTKPSHLPGSVQRTLRLSYAGGLGSVPGRHQLIEVNTMNTKSAGKSRITIAALAMAGVATLGLCATSYAGCADAKWSDAPSALDRGGAVSQLMNSTPGGAFVRIADRPTIVGLWKFEMISKSTPTHRNPMPDGTLIDFGTAAWHADGTELQTSGIRNPSDGDVCQGVWQQVDAETFVLNHYALAWTNGTYTGPANIRARVTLDPTGNHYRGMFATVVYLATPVAGHEFDESTILASITGTFTATRVTMR